MVARIVFSACILFLSALSCSAKEGATLDRISSAEKDYASGIARHRDELLAMLEKKREVAQKKGDLSALQMIEDEMEQFEKHGNLPKSVPTASYVRKMELSKAKLVSEYESVIKDLTKSGEIETAKAIQETLDRFKSGKAVVPHDAVRKGRFAYKVFLDRMTWDQAKMKCAEFGGRIARIDNKDENDFLTKVARDAKLPAIWLEISDSQSEGNWLHVDSSKLRFDHWDRASGQPNNAKGVEHHAVLLTDPVKDGRWWDYPNDPRAYPELSGKGLPGFVCQWVLDSRE